MLVLSRKLDEAIQIDENITIKVLEVRGGQVRLGIEAPRSINIVRSELIADSSAMRDTEGETHRESRRSRTSAAV